MEEVGFGQIGIAEMEEVIFGLTGMAWNRGSQF
jgi:hypothetical protein